jgi:hypothetical protein
MVNWTAIGRKKKRLRREQSIRTSKMMYEWTNVGKQKAKMGKDETCPCCGIAVEDQLHLYQCENEKMTTAFYEGLDNLQKTMRDAEIPAKVFVSISNIICKASKCQKINKFDVQCEATLETAEQQMNLGLEQTLQGFLISDWVEILQTVWVPPRMVEGKLEPKKDPLEQATTMIGEVWDLFEKLWECQNSILHGKENTLLDKHLNGLNQRLLEFRINSNTMLRHNDRHFIEYPVTEVIKWPVLRKKAASEQLEQLHRVYMGEQTRKNLKVRDISEYFVKLDSDDVDT